jgi:hypothetical protein
MTTGPLLLDSITDATDAAHGRVVICGSHGGLYPGAIASKAGVRAVVFNDAGIGLDRAGIAGVLALESIGMAAAAVDCQSCHIGSASDSAARGIISVANLVARDCGVRPGMSVTQAAGLLALAPTPKAHLPDVTEARHVETVGSNGLIVQCLDSASLVGPQDVGKVVITGSHGALIGGDPARALKAAARVAVFNDAGFGLDRIGITRLAALDRTGGGTGIAAVTVSCRTARIGDAHSALETGVISCTNRTARALGAVQNEQLATWLARLS